MSDIDFSWMRKGACVGDDRNLWFPSVGGATNAARKICSGCEVKQECLDYAMVYEEFGIWGGMSPEERNRYRRKMKVGIKRNSRV